MRSLHEKLAKKYEVLDLLGEGATSAAYKARRLVDGNLCVLKVFLKPLDADEGRLRFDRECKALARLDHPHIVKMLEWGVVDDVSYLALQHVECKTLADRLKKGKIPWRQAVAMTATLAEALHYTHKKGMVHRDIKPQNILLLKDGSPMLIDFGLVKSGHMASHQTATGVVLGTPSYMAPELFGTEKASVSTDIYALGVVLYQLLAGYAPYSGSLENILKAKFKNPPTLPHRPGDEVYPKALAALVAQLIEPKAVNRYGGSAKDLANGLRQILNIKIETAALTTKRARQPNGEAGAKRASWPFVLVLPLLILLIVFFPSQSNEKLSADWSLAKLGRYAKENGSLGHLAPKKACHVEVLGRLLRAKLQLGKDECVAALETLKPLLTSGRLEIVKRSDKLTKMAIKAVEGAAREDIGQAEEGDVLLLGLTLGKKRKLQKEGTLQLINEHFLTLSKKRRIVATLRCLLVDLQRMSIDLEAFVKAALPLLEESKQFGDDSTIHRHAKLQAFAHEVVPLVTLWTALVHSSSLTWQKSEPPWQMLLAQVKRLQQFPRVSIFEKSASTQLSHVPFPKTMAAPLAEFYKVLLKQQNSNADFRHGARLGWQNCFSTLHFYNPELSVDYELLKHDCLDKQLVHRKAPYNLLPPKLLFHWIMYRAGCTMKRTAQSLEHLAALDKEIYDYPGLVHPFLQVTLLLSSYGDENFKKAMLNIFCEQLQKQRNPELKALIKATLIAVATEQVKLPQVDELDDGKLARFGYAARQFPWLQEILPNELSDQEIGLLMLLPGRSSGGQQPPKTVLLAMKRLLKSWSTRKLGLPWIPRFLPILWTSGEWRQKELVRQLVSSVPLTKTAEQRLFALSVLCYESAESYFDFVTSLPTLRKGIEAKRLALFDQEQFLTLFRTRSLAKEYFGSTAISAEAASSMLLALKNSGERASKENVMVWFNIALLLSDIVEYMDCLTPNNLRRGIAGFTRKKQAPVVCDFGRLAVPIADSIPEEFLPKGLAMFLRLHRVRIHHYARRESGNAAKILATCSAAEVPAVYRWFYWLWMLRLSVDGNGSPLRNTELNKIAKSQDYANTSAVLRVYMKAALRK